MRSTLIYLVTWLCLIAEVQAHSTLIGVDPPDGSILPVAPQSVQLRFNEPITPAVIHLIDASGRVRDAAIDAHDDTITIRIPSDLPRGTQVVSYRIISADGHPVSGSVLFSIGAPSGAVAQVNSSDPVTAVLIWLGRVGIYIGLFAGIGGVFFVTWFAPERPARGPIATALAIGTAAAFFSLGLQGLDLLGLPISALASEKTWQAGWGTSLGPSLAIAFVGMISSSLALRSNTPRQRRLLASLGLLAVGGTLSVSGHASTASPEWLMRPAIFVHGLCIAFWLGALLPLLTMAVRSGSGLRAVLERFSDIAIPVVVVLVASGTVLASFQLATPTAFFATTYGRLLTAKLAAVLLMLGLAALNRFRFSANASRKTRPLVLSVAAEGVLALTIFGIVAGWRFTVPPRALAAVEQTAPAYVHMMGADAMVSATSTPGRVGSNDFSFEVMDASMQALKPEGVTLTLDLPSAGIEPVTREASLASDGLWHISGVVLPQPGSWHVRVDVLVNDFKELTLEDTFQIRP